MGRGVFGISKGGIGGEVVLALEVLLDEVVLEEEVVAAAIEAWTFSGVM
jgi:hypothetical protein